MATANVSSRDSPIPGGTRLKAISWLRAAVYQLGFIGRNTLSDHEDGVVSVSFSPDGQAVASASGDGTVILWNFDLEDLLDRSCDWFSDYLQNPAVPDAEKRALCPDRVAPLRQAASPTRSPFGQVVGWVRQWFDLT